MRVIVIEGSPEDVGKALKELGPPADIRAVIEASPQPPTKRADDEGDRKFVSVEIARRVMSRRPLSREQRSVLIEIYDAHPGDVLASALQQKVNYSKAQFAGLMGAFGRRLTRTPGYVDPTWFFDNLWDDEEGCNRYRLPETVREAMRLEGLVT